MTPTEKLSHLLALHEKATAPPWLVYPRPCGYLGDFRVGGSEQLITYEVGTDKPNWVAHTLLRDDAKYIEAAHNGLPTLIRAVQVALAAECGTCGGKGVIEQMAPARFTEYEYTTVIQSGGMETVPCPSCAWKREMQKVLEGL